MRYIVLCQFKGRKFSSMASRAFDDLSSAYNEAIRLRKETGAVFAWVEAKPLAAVEKMFMVPHE